VPQKPVEPDPQSVLPLPVAVFHILVALADEERHGYAIMQDVAERTGGRLKLSAGTLYGAIKRMLEDGLIEETAERPDAEDHDERRRYYRVTSFGREAAMAEAERLSQLVSRAQAIGWLPKQLPKQG
jgi:DNA-binding PadR family transcriptional regulator